MKEQLARLEKQIQSIVEGSLARLLGAEISAPEVTAQVARAMDDGVRIDDQGRPQAPDEYALTLHPDDIAALADTAPDIAAELGRGLLEAARGAGYMLGREPRITIGSDPTLPRRQVRVLAWHGDTPLEFTRGMPQEPDDAQGGTPPGAFLIIDGHRHYPLDRPVVNIGRRLDNQIILENLHISRTHAQLRLREGRFVLFDLGSTAGCYVNGRPIRQHVLLPGDVVTLGAVRLVYGEDPGGPPDATPVYKPPFPPRPTGDQRTHSSGWDDKPDS